MKSFTRKEILRLLGFMGVSTVFGSVASKFQGIKSSVDKSFKDNPVIEKERLPDSGPWPTKDPFLFCVHHNDHYPKGDSSLGPNETLQGRDIGQDFSNKDGWSMYHGHKVPGFPRHPHRGFETVTVVRKGLIDHADSLGSAARYGNGDVQWLTAGDGIQHAEMFPLFNKTKSNPMSFFQIWLNLPASRKRVKPNFTMFWADSVPIINVQDRSGKLSTITLISGRYGQNFSPKAPTDSWAADKDSDVAIWSIKLSSGATWVMPKTNKATVRSLYLINSGDIILNSERISGKSKVEIKSDIDIKIKDLGQGMELLLLQGRPISEPVSKHGPFVMNSQSEIREAYHDYQKTQFGGWDWDSDAPVHGSDPKRFAKYINGETEYPG